ncbi:glycosyltransferase [Lacicoccus alkaliphilus]|uniref:Glycosyltransferase involved in cell wall bisynthesis n=1 Tax=Lacicoccus alkaliphilus DSM 16010 TaxID=1123231 RepID=A0A1M7FXG2_9BACL|nr:glycosyltransferase [Salinicoccus alkaliphilus]SHM08339.1 Glycosyltransferase involved in cell wall bisynthesis [Salinicoccus alkaliphilus DSM 16010]
MLRILHITPSLAGGGAERMISKLTKYDHTNEHIIISLLDMNIHYEFENVKIIDLKLKNGLRSKFLLIFKLYKYVKNLKPDIIQTWSKANFYGPFLSFFNNSKVVSNYRNGYYGTHNKFLIILYNLFFNRFDAHIFVSESALKERKKVGIKLSNCQIIKNGFEIPTYSNELINDTLRIGHMGRFHNIKNQQLIIDAFREFCGDKKTLLYLAGKNLNGENLNLKDIPDSKIKLMGEIKETEKFYNNIDIFILSSDSEGFPNVIGEAMSYGIPVISTDAGESFKIIGENGFKIHDKESLLKVLNEIYMNRQLLIEKGRKSRKRVEEKFDIKDTVKEYQTFYRYITGG